MIDQIYEQAPDLRKRIEQSSLQRAIESLRIADDFRRREAIKTTQAALDVEKRDLEQRLTQTIKVEYPEYRA